jgi:Terpene cyclase DEP1
MLHSSQHTEHNTNKQGEGTMTRTMLIIVLIAFGAQGLYVMSQVGYWGIWINNLNHPAGQQVLADLVIALTLVMVWMWRDAQRTGRNVWPWIAFTLIAGSFGPLLYLLTHKHLKGTPL